MITCNMVQRLCRQEPKQAMLLSVLGDGKTNVPLPDSQRGDAWDQTEQIAAQLTRLAIPTLMLDMVAGHVRFGRCK